MWNEKIELVGLHDWSYSIEGSCSISHQNDQGPCDVVCQILSMKLIGKDQTLRLLLEIWDGFVDRTAKDFYKRKIVLFWNPLHTHFSTSDVGKWFILKNLLPQNYQGQSEFKFHRKSGIVSLKEDDPLVDMIYKYFCLQYFMNLSKDLMRKIWKMIFQSLTIQSISLIFQKSNRRKPTFMFWN